MLSQRLIIDPRQLDTEKKNDLYLNGKINPKDFIEIGDLLILKCPSLSEMKQKIITLKNFQRKSNI